MNPMMQQQMPTEKELWKDEPNKLRIWIILFSIALVIFAIFSITGAALTIANQHELELNLQNALKLNSDAAEKSISNTVLWNFIVIPCIYGVVAVTSIIYFWSVLPKSYKKHTFANLPSTPIWLALAIGFIALFNSIGTVRKISLVDQHTGAILVLVSSFFSIALLFFALPVSRIRRTFVAAKAYEELQKSPEFQQMQQQMQNFFNQAATGQNPGSPFGPTPGAATNTSQNKPQEAEVKQKTSEESNEMKELKKLKISELRQIASKLSISGSDKMPKPELIQSIIRITNQK